MSMYRTSTYTPETVITRDYSVDPKMIHQVGFSIWLIKYNRINKSKHKVSDCPKYVKQLYRTIHYNDLAR